MNLDTSLLGSITSFDPATQTASITLLHNTVVNSANSNYTMTSPTTLSEVPVHFMRIGNFTITAEPKVGDVCIILFMQSGINHWVYGGRVEYIAIEGRPEPDALRGHSKSNAVAIVGLSNLLDPIKRFDAGKLVLRSLDSKTSLSLSEEGVTITRNDVDEDTVTPKTSLKNNRRRYRDYNKR